MNVAFLHLLNPVKMSCIGKNLVNHDRAAALHLRESELPRFSNAVVTGTGRGLYLIRALHSLCWRAEWPLHGGPAGAEQMQSPPPET